MAASSSSHEAARFIPQRASRSAPRVLVPETTTTALVLSTTTLAPAPVPVTAAARRVAPTPTTRRTTTTVKRKPTPTTAKPRPTTTAKPQPTAPPEMRPMTPPTPASATGQSETGKATWYKAPEATMCAHKTIPFGTIVTVTASNGKSTTCKVGDRGPYVDGYIIDLSPESFSQLAPLSEGRLDVTVTW
jgi:rare lipoprotein A (peptidoglycan hydrolase)